MRKVLIVSALVFLFSSFYPVNLLAATASLVVLPGNSVVQGEPLLVVVNGVATTTTIKSIVFDGKSVGVMTYQGKPGAFIGIDLNKKPGVYQLTVNMTSGQTLTQQITVIERKKIEASLGIPEKLGGNTAASQQNLVSSLSDENAQLSKIKTFARALWTKPFIFPISSPQVTDPYGYTRETGSYTIAHKGTDLHADEGTKVAAMNRGIVRVAKSFPTYGKTIVVDHGLGLMSFYMHLSKINVAVGQLVQQGQLIGLSGQTGYADAPHLHLTVRIDGTSIDPMKFMNLFVK